MLVKIGQKFFKELKKKFIQIWQINKFITVFKSIFSDDAFGIQCNVYTRL